MKNLPSEVRGLGVKAVTVMQAEGTELEHQFEVEAHIQPATGFFPVDAPIQEGDVVEYPDARGGRSRKIANRVDVLDVGPESLQHIEVKWGNAPPRRVAAVQRVGLSGLHTDVIAASSNLFTDGHYSQAVFEAFKALEARVRRQSRLDLSGRDLMNKSFSGDPPVIDLSVESGQSGRDEQEGLRFVFMGVLQGIRNPKGHELVRQDDPQRAIEYLAVASILFRRLDDAEAKSD